MSKRLAIVWSCIAGAAALIAAAAPALAQSYPSRPVRVVVPAPPGGGIDAVARIIAPRMGDELGQSFVVEYRPGASTTIGSASVARAAPDGYTLLMNASSFIMSRLILKNVPYDPVADFTPVAQVASGPLLFVTSTKSSAASVAELVALAKARPGQLSIANPTSGSPMDFASVMFRHMAGLEMITPAYSGVGPAVVDVTGAQVTAVFAPLPSTLSLVQAGRLKALAVTSRERSSLVPDVPTMAESGLAGFDVASWYGLWAPAKTPPEVVARLQSAAARAVPHPEVKKQLVTQGMDPAGSPPERFAEHIRTEFEKLSKLIRDAGLKFD